MNYMEIIFKNIKKSYLDQIVGGAIGFDVSDIRSFHFYDKQKGKEIGYSDIESLAAYFQDSGSCNIFLEKIWLGMELKEVLLLICCDGETGDITLSFLGEQFENRESGGLKSDVYRLMQGIVEICARCEVSEAVIGYEPAEDVDMKIVEIKEGCLHNCNEDVHQSKAAQAFRQTAKDMAFNIDFLRQSLYD